MSTQLISLGFLDFNVTPGSHIAYFFSDDKQRQSDLLSFVSAGILNNEMCITAIPEYPRKFWIDGLHEKGIDDDSIAKQLKILTPSDLYGVKENQHAHKALAVLRRVFREALEEGWHCVRICTGFGELYHDKEHAMVWLSEENQELRSLSEGKLTLLCTFDLTRLHPWVIDLCRRLHPLLTDGITLKVNRNYTITDENLPGELERLSNTGALSSNFAHLSFICDTPLVKVGEELDVFTAKEVEDLMNRLIDLGHNHLIVDLSGTSFIDVEAVNTLLRIARTLEGMHGRLVIYDPLDQPRKLFQLIKLADRIPIFLSPEDAQQSIM